MSDTQTNDHLPGLEEAISQLRRDTSARCDVDDLYADLFDDPLPEVPDTCPLDVGSALTALATLQLGAAHAAAGSPGMIPPASVLHLIEVPDTAARERVARIVDGMIDAGAASGVQKPQVIEQIGSGKSVDAEMFQRKIEKALLKGLGVIAIPEAGTPLPDTLRRRAALTLPLAPTSAAMLRALLSEIHGIGEFDLDLSDADAAAFADLDFAAIFAAPSLEEARTQLTRLSTPDTPPSGQVKLADVQGQPAARAAFEHLCADLVEWRAGALDWFEVTRSFLLHGPPGNGKTMLSEALAGSAGVPLIATSYADNQRLGHQGDMLKGLTEAVTRACDSAPSIFFIDEIDAFYTRGRSHNGYMIGVVTGLLTQLDRLMKTDGVILLAATNHPDTVDPAIRRAGRFDQHIPVTAPDRAGVQAILAGAAPDIPAPDLARLADRLLGRSGAEITALVRSARTHARRRGGALAVRDLDAAADDLGPAPDPDTLYRVAVHEAGHLLAGQLFGAPAPKSATLRTSGGVVERLMPPFLTRARVDALVRMMLGGRTAEALIFDEVSSGSGGDERSDLAMATQLLIDAETRLGLGETLTWQSPDITARLLAHGSRTRIEDALRTAESEAREALRHHRADLDRIAKALLDKRELTAQDLTALLDPVCPDKAMDVPDTGHADQLTPHTLSRT